MGGVLGGTGPSGNARDLQIMGYLIIGSAMYEAAVRM
jgi:hypothetical protein